MYSKIISSYNKLMGMRFWYTVEFMVKSRSGEYIATGHQELGFVYKRQVLSGRGIRKHLGKKLFEHKELHNKGAVIVYKTVCYLGYFKEVK